QLAAAFRPQNIVFSLYSLFTNALFTDCLYTNLLICLQTSIKEGFLLKQTSSFQRWKRRYFKLRGRTLYYAKDSKSLIFDEVDLSDASVAESSTKNVNNSFTVITPFRRLILCAENRKEMEDWITSLKSVQSREHYETAQFNVEHFSGMHNWYACSHARPTFCNVCRESLSGVTSHGLSCEVCKFKAHKRCAVRAINNCKWTTLASIGKDIIEDEDGIAMPHQWLEGNLPVSAKCSVCDKTCGSVLRLQDWRCLWCKAMVHTACKDPFPRKCPLGQCKVSIIPPTALNSIDSDGFWKATCPPSCASPLLVFVNSKSGDNQGVKFLRRFKQLLNPAQVFDLMNGGPHLGLRLFQKFDNFRILVCGGDGSVGWVLSEIDKLNLHKQCQLGVLPLGTGNDLARVLGWGGSCDDDTQLPQILEKLERASTKMLDRWSIMTYEIKIPSKQTLAVNPEEDTEESEVSFQISAYEDSVAAHLAKILNSDQHSVVISSAKILCETVKDFVAKVGKTYEKTNENTEETEALANKCSALNEKLDLLLQALKDESQVTAVQSRSTPPIVEEEEEFNEESSDTKETALESITARSSTQKFFKPREQLMLRANSLKKAVRQIIEQAEKGTAHLDREGFQCRLQFLLWVYCFILAFSNRNINKLVIWAFPSLDVRPAPRSPERRVHRSTTSYTGPFSSSPLTASKENLPVLNTRIICPGSDHVRTLINFNKICLFLFNSREGYHEKCVMNNYFGIGLDAKISLEFNNKREEHPEKCRSRTKNMMWYGVLGTKELLQRTYKNLEQKVQLECDGQYIPLPSLQGIAVLNIPSYAGGTNFWGGTKEDDIFGAPSFDDKILEVVAVFGSMQMAVSRVIKLQHHRIAQCRSVKITILGDEGVPVQVDGEAWIQPPGVIKIMHKNRAQMLTRDRVTKTHSLLEQELAHAVNASSHALNKTHPKFPEQLDSPQEEQLSTALHSVDIELRKLAEIPWLYYVLQPTDEELVIQRIKGLLLLTLVVQKWGTDEVASWLELLSLGEYKEIFIRHDIRGSELLHLERRDLKDLGITKVGHMKRILQGIKELGKNTSMSEV
uniref:Diacylglycerol kinase n=1 Tax=Callorhinchus milii TaxID=7868 RepID=A0A4W3HB67_CALMI